jgi:hypothetical protein
MGKRDQSGRTRHNGKVHPSRHSGLSTITTAKGMVLPVPKEKEPKQQSKKGFKKTSTKSPSSNPTSKYSKKPHQRNLYTPNAPFQHLKINDPNMILISATTPMQSNIRYICKRLNETSLQNETLISSHNSCESTQPELQTVVISGTNSSIQSVVSILEVLKRRCPSLLYTINIGTVDNSHRLQAFDIDHKANENSAECSKDNSQHTPLHDHIAYAIQVVFLLQESVQLDTD